MSFTSRDDRTLRGRLTQWIDDAIADSTEYLAKGAASSYEDYRWRVGGLEVLRLVRRQIDEIVADLNASPLRD